MNIESSVVKNTNQTQSQSIKSAQNNPSANFVDELQELQNNNNIENNQPEDKSIQESENTAKTTSQPLNINQEFLNEKNHTNNNSELSSDIDSKKMITQNFSSDVNSDDIDNCELSTDTNSEEIITSELLNNRESELFSKDDSVLVEQNSVEETVTQNIPKKADTDAIIKDDELKSNLDKSLEELNLIVHEFNQSDEHPREKLKKEDDLSDNNKKGDNLINNDFNIQDKKDIMPQMSPNMNFSGDGQPFSSFMGNENNEKNSKQVLKSTVAELKEESEILSTMAENIAMANKNSIVQESEKIVNREEGIKKIDTKSGITIENIVKYDSIIMNEADVEVFAALVEQGEISMDNMAPEAAKKSVQISKTLADMLARAKENQQPLRIDFDNGISVIIKISRDGKISADFLPSTQVAEAYLKENLPILKQRFDEKNIDYDELNRRERRDSNREDNRKKGRKDE